MSRRSQRSHAKAGRISMGTHWCKHAMVFVDAEGDGRMVLQCWRIYVPPGVDDVHAFPTSKYVDSDQDDGNWNTYRSREEAEGALLTLKRNIGTRIKILMGKIGVYQCARKSGTGVMVIHWHLGLRAESSVSSGTTSIKSTLPPSTDRRKLSV